jgi:acyl-coenzyme A thioesterase PaaI-like protein
MTTYQGPEQGRDVSRYVGVELHETADLRVEGHAPASPHLRGGHGGVRAGALLTMLDNVGGLCGGLAALPDGWVVSTNLAARTFRTAHTGPLRIDAEVLRRGRNNVVTGVQIRDEGAANALVTDGVLTSAILVPENGPPQWSRPLTIEPGERPLEPLPPIPEWLDVQTVDDATIEIGLADALRNPWGILHGGVVAALVDLAAEHATRGIVTDVVLHFLAPNRIGPVRAESRVLGTRADGTICRIEVRDTGADRVTAIAIVTAALSSVAAG